MKQVFIKCNASDCLHYSSIEKNCCISDDTFIDISSNGMCLDYAPITDDEMKEILGVFQK